MEPRAFLNQVAGVLSAINTGEVSALTDAVERCYREGRTVFIIGNGGSGSNASHMCEDLGKGTLTDFERQKRLKVLSLTDNTPYILAWGNDEGYDRIFVEQLRNLASPGDLLIAISGSGNSPNVLRAVEYADRIGMETFGMTGFTGGKLKSLCRRTLHIQVHDMGITESMHTVVFHYLIVELKERFRRIHEETPPPPPSPGGRGGVALSKRQGGAASKSYTLRVRSGYRTSKGYKIPICYGVWITPRPAPPASEERASLAPPFLHEQERWERPL